MDRSACETEIQRVREGTANILQHLAECGTMTFVDDEHDAFAGELLHFLFGDMPLACFDVAHFLNGRDDKRVLRVDACQLRLEHIRVFRTLHVVGIIGERTVFEQRLRTQLDTVHKEDDLVSIFRAGNELRRFETGHGFARAGGMPHIAARASRSTAWHRLIPFAGAYTIGNGVHRLVLVAAQHFEASVRGICNRVETDELMSHGNGQQVRREPFPLVLPNMFVRRYGLVVEVGPVEEVVAVEVAFARIGEVHGIVRIHGHEDLHESEQSGEHAFMRVFGDLIGGLAYGDAAFLQFDMDDRHAVDKQANVSPAIVQHLVFRRVHRLSCDLVPALPRCYFLPIVDFQADFLAEMCRICWIITFDGHGLAVDEGVQRQWCAQCFDLFEDLRHLTFGKALPIQSIDAFVVVEQDVGPIADKVLFGWIFQHAIGPSMALQHRDQIVFEIRFFIVEHVSSPRMRRHFLSPILRAQPLTSKKQHHNTYADEG